ncbi:MAG TPA: hypothetical protein DCP92_12150 [Nitrospiraceae bacterium]|nr:hypothetical protein [Nitrospiraceae bacterium]
MEPWCIRAECCRRKVFGEPYDGERHVRIDEGMLETEAMTRSSGTLTRKGRNGEGSQGLMLIPRQRPTLQRRNVKEHLPKKHQNTIDARISAAYKMTDYDEARKSLELTVGYLEKLNPSAAASLKEGLEETLTVHKLGIAGLLRKTLLTTNPIESCFSVTRTVTGRVKRWRDDNMTQRWAVAALLRAEKKFRRVKGYREIPKLAAVLQHKSLDRKEVAA